MREYFTRQQTVYSTLQTNRSRIQREEAARKQQAEDRTLQAYQQRKDAERQSLLRAEWRQVVRAHRDVVRNHDERASMVVEINHRRAGYVWSQRPSMTFEELEAEARRETPSSRTFLEARAVQVADEGTQLKGDYVNRAHALRRTIAREALDAERQVWPPGWPQE